ncbi:MAG: monovalent cation/H(+) antiporter subunit G [Desulfobacterales bacterium]|jgi:multicomponent Na+:H+ antiporter subunit G
MINEIVTALLLVLGSLFSFVAALGMLRLPDTVIRMHAATKAGTLGAGLILIAEAFFYAESGITLRALAAITFLLLTAPVAAHLIGRAAYYSGIRLWKKTWIDQLKDRYPPGNRPEQTGR